MKRATLLVVPLLLLVVLLLAVVAEVPTRRGLPAGVQSSLNAYLIYVATRADVEVVRVERATRPWKLETSIGAIFGYSAFYQTDIGPGGTPGSGTRPLPYPPQELWCVLLHRKENRTGRTWRPVILIGQHADIYNADWVVHELPREISIPALVDRLSQLGCDLDLLEDAPDDGQARRPLGHD
ncbi:MAG: hypothetical protein PVF47_08420 [Anaerolineae bacterium]|jgi:hypothetical protein